MNIVKGSIITVKEPVFGGSFKRPKYIGDRTYKALVLKENYGASCQHTFSLEILEASGVESEKLLKLKKTNRKGRNLYPNLVNIEQPKDYESQAEAKAERREFNNLMKSIT